MELCTHCRKPILSPNLVYAEDHTGDEQPFHKPCLELVTSADYQGYLAERRSWRRYTDEERARI